uniref:Uncharacterized protein n=1 Tax=Fagus sylvatica TaxID=28930 RepID=A0A2N9IA14_FAGSY
MARAMKVGQTPLFSKVYCNQWKIHSSHTLLSMAHVTEGFEGISCQIRLSSSLGFHMALVCTLVLDFGVGV